MPTKFWMVKGNGPTSKVHLTKLDAFTEAFRLARINKGQRFTILEATEEIEVEEAPCKVTTIDGVCNETI